MTDWASSGQLVGGAAGDTADTADTTGDMGDMGNMGKMGDTGNMGKMGGNLRFDAMRTSELDRLAESARKILQEYDTKEEANRLASRVQSSMLQTAAFEIGAGERDTHSYTLIHYY